LHWSKIQAQNKHKEKVKEKQKVKIILMGSGHEKERPKKNPFLPSSSKIKKKHIAKGAEPPPAPEHAGKNLFEGMDLGSLDLLDEHDDDHDVAAEFESHQGLLANVHGGAHKQKKGKLGFLSRSETRLLDDLFENLDDDEDDQVSSDMMGKALSGPRAAGDMMAALMLQEDAMEHEEQGRKPQAVRSAKSVKKLKQVRGWGFKKKK
jgi:hypothetical protein